MADLLANLTDKITYNVHKLTYDPEAEKYAQSARLSAEVEKETRDKQAARDAAAADAEKAAAAAKAQQEADAKKRAANAEFSAGRFAGKTMGVVTMVLLAFGLFVVCMFGASLATNLNVYKNWPYRVLYALYGFIFSPVVIVYVFAYRWFWLGKKPRFYSILPLIPYHLNDPWAQQLLAWISYRPDEVLQKLEEWDPTKVEAGIRAECRVGNSD